MKGNERDKYMTSGNTYQAIQRLVAQANAAKTAKLFESKVRNWLAHHALDLASSSAWTHGDFQALQAISDPVGGVESFASLLDLAVNSWPLANPQISEHRPQFVECLCRSELVTPEARFWSRSLADSSVSVESPQALTLTRHQQRMIEREIVEHAANNGDPKDLSTAAIQYLHWFFKALLFVYLSIEVQGTVRTELCFYQPRLSPFITANQAAKAVRVFFCEPDKPEVNWARYRQVRGSGVNLRAGPSISAEVLAGSLPDRAILEVLDSSDRNWLQVSVVEEDGMEGWVSRRYTHKLHR